MSKLDKLLNETYSPSPELLAEDKPKFKALMLEIIGPDEPNTTPAALWCNQTKAELREKVKAL